MLKIGWCTKDVSTSDPLPITGQFKLRVSQGVLDPILVNILTLENNGDYVIFVQVDTVGISAGILDLVRARVSELNPEIDTTKIIIAQRVSSIEDADMILVMDGGNIVNIGNHEQLMKDSVIYREIFEQQTKGGTDNDEE